MNREGRAPPRVSLDIHRLLVHRLACQSILLQPSPRLCATSAGMTRTPQSPARWTVVPRRIPNSGTPTTASPMRHRKTHPMFASTSTSRNSHSPPRSVSFGITGGPLRRLSSDGYGERRGLAPGTTLRRLAARLFELILHRHDVLLVALPAQLVEEC